MAKKLHVKPTIEELDSKIEEVIEETKDLEEKPEPIEEEKPIVYPREPEVEEPEPEVEVEEPEAEPSEEEKEKLRIELEQKKQKLSASAREAQKLSAKNRVITKAIVDAEDIQEPTEDELKEEYVDWEIMSDTEKKYAKEAVLSKRFRSMIATAKEQATKIEKWNDSVDDFVADPKTLNDTPELEGKEDDFADFAKAEANNSVPFNILVSAFLHDQSTKVVKNKGKMFETGSGGSNEKPTPKSDKLSLDDSRKLRTTDYNKWVQYVREGKIDIEL